MNFIIPMAGHGARFAKAGYQLPKMLLEAHGKTLLQWSVDSLPLHLANKVIFIGLREHDIQFDLQRITERLYPELNSEFIFLDKVTQGQAATCCLALDYCNADEPMVIFNIDTFFISSTLEDNLRKPQLDGILGCFTSNENRFSFASVNENNSYVKEVREKEVISDHALTGLYTFKNTDDFFNAYEHQLTNNLTVNGEYYVAPMYNYLIQQGKKYILDKADKHYILGTPQEYDHFLSLKHF